MQNCVIQCRLRVPAFYIVRFSFNEIFFLKIINIKVEFCKNVFLVIIIIKQRSFGFFIFILLFIPTFKQVLNHSLVACIYTWIHHLVTPERYYLQDNAKNSNEVDLAWKCRFKFVCTATLCLYSQYASN